MKRILSTVVRILSLTGLPYVIFLAVYYFKHPEGSPAKKQHVEPSVSIVLPTYNEAQLIEKKLTELVNLTYPLEKIEIIVVDSSTDETPNLVESFFDGRQYPELTLIRESERRGLATALNEAYTAATNDIVIKTDCDSRIAEDAIREAVANLADPEIAAVTGRNAEVLGGSRVERGYRDIQTLVQTVESHIDSTLIFHGPFSAFERDVIVPIDEDSIADDTELALKIRKQGKRVVFDPAIRYKEAAHSSFGKRRQQKDRRAMGLLRLLWRQRDMLGRYGNYGRIVLPFNWWFMLISPWLVVTALALVVFGSLATGVGGLLVLALLATILFVGSRDRLGAAQPLYSLFDTQISLFWASIQLLRGKGDGTWTVDQELREMFD